MVILQGLKRGLLRHNGSVSIDFISFCLKQGIFSRTINSMRVCSTYVLNRVSKIGILP